MHLFVFEVAGKISHFWRTIVLTISYI